MRLLLLLGLLLSVGISQAQIYSNEFLSIGVGARGQAMGNSVVASSTGIYATYWNPAGLAAVDNSTGLLAGAMHAEQFAGVSGYDYIAFSLPLAGEGKRVAVSLIRQGTDNIPNTLNLYNPDGTADYGNITRFSVADYAGLLSYAQTTKWLDGRVAIGGNFKLIRRVIGDFSSAWGVGLDAGLRYTDGKLAAGLMLRDVTSTFNSWKTDLTDDQRTVLLATGNTLPDRSGSETTRPSLLPSVRYRFERGQFGFAPEATAWVTFDGQRNTLLSADPVSVDVNLGLEADYRQLVFLRLGVDQWQRFQPLGDDAEKLSARPAIGLGVKIKRVNLDYAFSNPGDDQSLYAHVFSLQLGLQRPTDSE